MKLSFSSLAAALIMAPTTMALVQDACPAGMPNEGMRRLEETPKFLRKLATTAVINNGVVQLGINEYGQLNVPDGGHVSGGIGLQFDLDGSWEESTAWGCVCEGIGVSATRADLTTFSGYANNALGTGGWDSVLGVVSDGTTATTSATTGGGDLKVTHYFHPAAETPNLYRVKVTLENLGTQTLTDIRYRRNMDWDIAPTPFNECVSVDTGNTKNIEYANDDGFQNNDPLFAWNTFGLNFDCGFPATDCSVLDNGPRDHGAAFQFLFKEDDGVTLIELPPGAKFSFDIYYGAGRTKTVADSALGAVGAQVYSYGYPPGSLGCNAGNPGSPNVFIFGFSGVGGDVIIDCDDCGVNGDPHIKKWNGQWFDFHGICDLVMVNAPEFDNGLGLDIQIRTKPRYEYSFIEQTAIKIGEDVFQVGSWGEYWLNGVESVELPVKLGGKYLVDQTVSNKKHHLFVITLDDETDESIVVRTYKDMVNVNVRKASKKNFGASSGLMGSFPGGVKFARDGVTVIEEDIPFGQEWQVSATDAKLFDSVNPNQPVAGVCVPPPATEGRRLGEVDMEAAEKACAHHTDQQARDMCIFDVIAMDDLGVAEMTGAY